MQWIEAMPIISDIVSILCHFSCATTVPYGNSSAPDAISKAAIFSTGSSEGSSKLFLVDPSKDKATDTKDTAADQAKEQLLEPDINFNEGWNPILYT